MGRNDRNSSGIDAVGLAAMTGREHSNLRGECFGNVDDFLAGRYELLGKVLAQPPCAFDCPPSLGPSGGPG